MFLYPICFRETDNLKTKNQLHIKMKEKKMENMWIENFGRFVMELG